MILIPSLELSEGRLVLHDGRAEPQIVEGVPLLEAARGLRDAGADFFQIVDLDSCAGGALQADALRVLPDAGLPCQAVVGDVAAAKAALELGVDRVVLDAGLLMTAVELLERHAMRVVARLDTRDAPQLLQALGESPVLRAVLSPAGELGARFSAGEVATAVCGGQAAAELEVLVQSPVQCGAELQQLIDEGAAGVVALGAYARVLATSERA